MERSLIGISELLATLIANKGFGAGNRFCRQFRGFSFLVPSSCCPGGLELLQGFVLVLLEPVQGTLNCFGLAPRVNGHQIRE